MNVEIAQRLADMRREKGYSQEVLAAKLGLSRQAVSKWERGESQPDTSNLIALADLYGVTLDELVRTKAHATAGESTEEPQGTTESEAENPKATEEATPEPAANNAGAAAGSPEPTAYAGDQPQPMDPQPQAAGYGVGTAQPIPPNAAPARRPHNPWYTFPYPLLVLVLFLMAGFLFTAWNPAWVLFLTIPFYYWIAFVITNDPNYRGRRDNRNEH